MPSGRATNSPRPGAWAPRTGEPRSPSSRRAARRSSRSRPSASSTRDRFGVGLSGPLRRTCRESSHVAGELGIPADALAVTGNVTVTNQTAGGYLSVTPTAVANPLSSTINFPVGDNRANNVTVPLSADGKLAAVYKAPSGKTTHLIFDVTGYFVAGQAEARVQAIDARSRPRQPVRHRDRAERAVPEGRPAGAGRSVPLTSQPRPWRSRAT